MFLERRRASLSDRRAVWSLRKEQNAVTAEVGQMRSKFTPFRGPSFSGYYLLSVVSMLFGFTLAMILLVAFLPSYTLAAEIFLIILCTLAVAAPLLLITRMVREWELAQAHLILYTVLTEDRVYDILRTFANRALAAFDNEVRHEKDKSCTEEQLEEASWEAKEYKKHFWELHSALRGLGIKLEGERIADYASSPPST